MTLNKFYNDFRTISITHRKRVLKNCDKIFEFESGRIKRATYNKEKKLEKYGNLLTVEPANLLKSDQKTIISESAVPTSIASSFQNIGPPTVSESLIQPNCQVVEP